MQTYDIIIDSPDILYSLFVDGVVSDFTVCSISGETTIGFGADITSNLFAGVSLESGNTMQLDTEVQMFSVSAYVYGDAAFAFESTGTLTFGATLSNPAAVEIDLSVVGNDLSLRRLRKLSEIDDSTWSVLDDWTMETFDYIAEGGA